MVVIAQHPVTSVSAAGRKRGTRELLILHLPFLENEAFPRIPSQRVLTIHQPDAGPDAGPERVLTRVLTHPRASSGQQEGSVRPSMGLCSVRKRCGCRSSSVSLSAAATSSSIPKVAVELASEAHMRLFTLTVAYLLEAASRYMPVTCYSTTASQG